MAAVWLVFVFECVGDGRAVVIVRGLDDSGAAAFVVVADGLGEDRVFVSRIGFGFSLSALFVEASEGTGFDNAAVAVGIFDLYGYAVVVVIHRMDRTLHRSRLIADDDGLAVRRVGGLCL